MAKPQLHNKPIRKANPLKSLREDRLQKDTFLLRKSSRTSGKIASVTGVFSTQEQQNHRAVKNARGWLCYAPPRPAADKGRTQRYGYHETDPHPRRSKFGREVVESLWPPATTWSTRGFATKWTT